MNTLEMIDDVRFNLTRSNVRDYTDAEIQRNIDEEYKKLQSIMQREGNIESHQQIESVNMTTTLHPLDINSHVERVEAKVVGSTHYTLLERTTFHDFGLAETKGCWCKNSLTDQIAHEGCPRKWIRTSSGIRVFPVHADGLDVQLYMRNKEDIDWTDATDEPRIPSEFHRLLTLKAGLMYRDLEDTNTIEWLNAQYNEMFQLFMEHVKEGGQVIQMKKKKKKYL